MNYKKGKENTPTAVGKCQEAKPSPLRAMPIFCLNDLSLNTLSLSVYIYPWQLQAWMPRFFDLCSGAATWRRANKQNRFRIIKFLPEVLLFKQQVFLEVLVS